MIASRKNLVRSSLWLCCLLILCGVILGVRHFYSAGFGLPYRDQFAKGMSDEWTAFGGTWELADGLMRNDSDERGAKLLTGSSKWQNYSVEADIMLLGLGGDAGLILRSSDEEQGVDAYTGYYAGLRTVDDSLVIGRAGHGWVEMRDKLQMKHKPVSASHWYHLKLLAYGCQIAATATMLPQGDSKTLAIQDDNCVRSGRAGLRSYASGGVWRHVLIQPSTQADLSAMLTAAAAPQAATSERKWTNEESPWEFYASASGTGSHFLPSSPNAKPIGDLRLADSVPAAITQVRGIIVLTSPALYVQDATGGVAVVQSHAQPLKVGDEVEITGKTRSAPFSAKLEDATVKVLWENSPMPPVSVTASQAATGAFDATFIEVEGHLTGKRRGPDDSLLFDFDAGPQSFQAVMNRGRGDSLYSKLKPGSLLRLRGICVSDPAYTHNLVPFALLLRSSDDAVILTGPPWWSATHVSALAAGLLLLAMAANFFYHRAESWRLHAVLEERERMAFEMHDTLSQSFAGIGFQLEAIREGMPSESPRLRQQLDLASQLVRHSHEETRRCIAVLRPAQPDGGDLLPALQKCAMRLVEGGAVKVKASCTGAVVDLPLRVADTFYHIGQEALANAVRHAHAATLTIQLVYEKRTVCLRICDDGQGFIAHGSPQGFGIRSMQRRATSIGAALEIVSDGIAGTEVSILSGLESSRALHRYLALSVVDLLRPIRHVTKTASSDPHSYR